MSSKKQLTREQLIVARRKCDESLLFFTRFFSKEALKTKFIHNWHHEELCQHFEDFSSYKLDLLNINISPRCSKTLIMIMTICRGAGMNHASNWLYITASDKLRKKTTTDIRRILTHPYFRIMYGLELSADQNSKDVIGFTGGGSLTTASVFGQIVGFGAGQMIDDEERKRLAVNNLSQYTERVFEGGIFCDDLNKPDDSVKENVNNDNVTDVLFNTIFSRKNSYDTPLANIQQRVGLTDVTNALMKHYGVEDNQKETVQVDRVRFVIMPIIYPDGRLLWEWRYPLSEITRLKSGAKTSHVFETQYMQNPQPMEGALFRADELSYFKINELQEGKFQTVGAIDVADKGQDYTSFPSGVLIGEKVYITEWLYDQQELPVTRPRIISIINHNKIDFTMVETNNIGIELGRALKKEVNIGRNIRGYYTSENKLAKIYRFADFIRTHFVFRSDVLPNSDYGKAMAHLHRYMADGSFKIDDAPDSLTLLVKLLQKLYPEKFA